MPHIQRTSLILLAGFAVTSSVHAQETKSNPWIGYTELSTNLPGGRHANVATMRAALVRASGIEQHSIAGELTGQADSWTQFAGWSPDGNSAIIGRGWESPENARWEEEHREFRFTAQSWLYDMYLLDLESGTLTNLTGVERASFYNTGLFFWPGRSDQLGFQALIDGNSHPFRMKQDGTSKQDLTQQSKEFAYGFQASPDGRLIAYHKAYQIFVANADGSEARKIATGQSFNFGPQWSPDGKHLLFLAGRHGDCHPYVASANGTEGKKIADRGRYPGVVAFLDVFDFHDGSSDTPVWSADGRSIFYTAAVGTSVEVFQATLNGRSEQITHAGEDTLHYHPQPSQDGRSLLFGSKRNGVRNLYVLELTSGAEARITDLPKGRAAMWPHWQPQKTK